MKYGSGFSMVKSFIITNIFDTENGVYWFEVGGELLIIPGPVLTPETGSWSADVRTVAA
jgi:hypothetical protein